MGKSANGDGTVVTRRHAACRKLQQIVLCRRQMRFSTSGRLVVPAHRLLTVGRCGHFMFSHPIHGILFRQKINLHLPLLAVFCATTLFFFCMTSLSDLHLLYW
jgi:hypothetical protein